MTPDEEKYLKRLGFEPVNQGKIDGYIDKRVADISKTIENNINSIIVSQKNIDADRFKFRAYFNNIKYTLDDEDENGDDIEIKKEASFYLYNITIYADGDGIGIQRDDFEKQLEEQGFSEDDIEALLDFHDSVSEDEYGWVWIGLPCKKEQYTGLKDKNGKLIYEGDILDDKEGGVIVRFGLAKRTLKSVIECEYSNPVRVVINCFYYEPINHLGIALFERENPKIAVSEPEIIGNIHENPELLGGAK